MQAFDYKNQKWVEGNEGTAILVKQLTETLALLKSDLGAEYALMVGVDCNEEIDRIELELNELIWE